MNIIVPNNKMWKKALKNLVERGELTVEQYNKSIKKLERGLKR